MPVDMAAGIAKRDTGGARESRHKRGQQQNNPDEDEDEETDQKYDADRFEQRPKSGNVDIA